jgi:hypothetical protein
MHPRQRALALAALVAFSLPAAAAKAVAYDVGPTFPYADLAAVPWESLMPGDNVLIHWRATPYNEKFVIGRAGTAAAPITVSGVPDPGSGALPEIDGGGAVTPPALNYWNEDRGIIKIGGSSSPPDTLPAYIVVENLDLHGARGAFTGDSGPGTYLPNAAAIYVEKGDHITVRNCWMHDNGNGFFVANETSDVLVEGNWIWGNGNVGSIYEHNNYTEANGIVFQFNHFGPLCTGCDGNNLKDRSAGTVIRYNWIESGNRQLDLVDSDVLYTEPSYGETFVYGNILIEPDGAGNSQIVHYGGDSGDTSVYRGGMLYFYNNTVVSTRAGNTTLFRLSSAGETADCRNNVLYVTADGSFLAIIDDAGVADLTNNWLKPGWVDTHSPPASGSVNVLGGEVNGASPGFVDEASQDFHLASGSACIDAGATLAAAALPANDVVMQYVVHTGSEPRPVSGALDLGAFELCPAAGCTPPAGTDAGAAPADAGAPGPDAGAGVGADSSLPGGDGGPAGSGDAGGPGEGGRGGCHCSVVPGPRSGARAADSGALAAWALGLGVLVHGLRRRARAAR